MPARRSLVAFARRPEPDAGVYTAMAFAKPYDCEQLPAVTAQQHTSNLQHPQQQRQRSGTSGQPPGILRPQDNPAAGESESENDNESDVKSDPGQIRVRSWAAREQWLTPDEFVEHLHSAPYDVLLGCDSWRACSSMVSGLTLSYVFPFTLISVLPWSRWVFFAPSTNAFMSIYHM